MNVSQTQITRKQSFLIVEFPEPLAVLSWAVIGGGRCKASRVMWAEVSSHEFRKQDFGKETVGLLTSARLDDYVDRTEQEGDYQVRSVVTAGLDNALRIGDPPTHSQKIGTINILCQISHPLSEAAMIEALSLAAEARTAAVLESRIVSPVSGLPATGTGTDCIVVAAPSASKGVQYVGKHTAIGALIGKCVFKAVQSGISVRNVREI